MEEDLLPYKDDMEDLGFKKRTKAVWNETTLQIHQDRILNQALAMNCLLQAVQLELATDRSDWLTAQSTYSANLMRVHTASCPHACHLDYHCVVRGGQEADP